MKADDIAFWSMIGSWVSGIATFLAVLMSLHIANRKPKPHIGWEIGERTIFGQNSQGMPIKEEGIAIKIVNKSTVPITIVSIGWKTGGSKQFYQNFGDVNSHDVPKRIEYGEQAFFWIKNEDDKRIINFARDLKEVKGSVRKLRCYISLSTGKTFLIKPEKDFLNRIEGLMIDPVE
jgi:hypothetical protein